MEMVYYIAILGTLFLGIIHSALTFKTYKKGDENAYWFFSAGLALAVTAIMNYINLKSQNVTSVQLTFIANLFIFLFSIALSLKFKKMTMYSVTLFTFLLVISSLLLLIK
ncbi:hypothetical protein [Fibrella aestuarina]|uniref:hypothetical protein n=1 Tax=Fibrella aestuarina TaxID=651143 RepID=UPI00059E38BB|nr:hypothetical protein [Fibrella aestuarina]